MHPKTEPKSDPKKAKPLRVEKDSGFNQSHGYGPGHGGPSGPGDAPSPPQSPATAVPPPKDEDEE